MTEENELEKLVSYGKAIDEALAEKNYATAMFLADNLPKEYKVEGLYRALEINLSREYLRNAPEDVREEGSRIYREAFDNFRAYLKNSYSNE